MIVGEASPELTGALVRRWAEGALAALTHARATLDELNLFPVPDADTGTNLLLTVASGQRRLAELPRAAGPIETAREFAAGTLVGARGNSGVILSQFFAGLADGLAEAGLADDGSADDGSVDSRADEIRPAPAVVLAAALDHAQRAAAGSVGRVVDGTMLTVARAAAEAARSSAGAGSDLSAVIAGALARARDAVESTRTGLPVLRRAGIVDAGALGFVIVLGALHAAVAGQVGPAGEDLESIMRSAVARPPASPEPAGHDVETDAAARHDTGGIEPGDPEFEVMFLVEVPTPTRSAVDAVLTGVLREAMAELGDSVAVVGAAGIWQVHVHTDHPHRAVSRGREVTTGASGVLRQVCIRHLGTRHATVGVVACTRAPGLVADLARAGAVVLLVSAESPARDDELERVIADTGAGHVVVLPGNADARAAAQALAASHPAVTVLDALTEAEVVAAVATLASNPELGPREAVRAAQQTLLGGRSAEVTDAAGLDAALGLLLAPPVAAGTVLTVVRGEGQGDHPHTSVDALVDEVRRRADAAGAEVLLLSGGQTFAALVLGTA